MATSRGEENDCLEWEDEQNINKDVGSEGDAVKRWKEGSVVRRMYGGERERR